MAVNCFLIKTKRSAVLVDTGIGNKLPPKNRDHYGIREDGRLRAELATLGVQAEDVDAVVFTHLHWDHAGGATTRDHTGLRVAFPRAVHYVQERDWEEAVCPNERTRGAFAPEDFLPLREEGRLRLLEGDSFLNKNVSLLVTGGHTTAHQIIRIASGGEVAYICGDLIPAVPFLHPAYATAYDLFPLTTLEAKLTLLRRAEKRAARLFLSHELETR
jgi:glyoxylase-like metal-dependent hydrolase (beta-lactamase superfamily II)